MVLTIAFHTNQLSCRGTEVALYDYAHFNESILGNRSVIVTKRCSEFHTDLAAARFAQRFEIRGYDSLQELNTILAQEQATLMYAMKAGTIDDVRPDVCPLCVHAVFGFREEHGDVYAYISEWLSHTASNGELPFVPHIVHLPKATANLRRNLGIPEGALVVGRHGGVDTFDVPFAQRAVLKAVEERDDIYFLFMNTEKFCEPNERILYLSPKADRQCISNFVNSCDVMLHARKSGETFGLAIAEFSFFGKPVMTWSGPRERAHLEILGEEALVYNEYEDLVELLVTFTRGEREVRPLYREKFPPEEVMLTFKKVFIDPVVNSRYLSGTKTNPVWRESHDR